MILISKYFIKNIPVIACFFVMAYLLLFFVSGNGIYGNLQGEWVSVDTPGKYIFTEKEYSYNTESGTYKIRGKKIIFPESGKEFFISVYIDYIVIDGQYYLKQ